MTLQQLRYLIAISETNSIRKAAEALFISQPSLSVAIQQLEEELGIKILNRSSRGVSLTQEGEELVGYAHQLLDQANAVVEKFSGEKGRNARFSVSCQHYSFAVEAFVDVVREFGGDSYDFTLRETQTYEIIEDVSRLTSEIGIIYLSPENETALARLFRHEGLEFHEIITARPHAFISCCHPLAEKEELTLEELDAYPFLSFEQGSHNSQYFSEELLSALDCSKNIKVRDRGTLFDMVIGLDGFTVSSGIISQHLNSDDIVARPIRMEGIMRIGYIIRKGSALSQYAQRYIERIKVHTCQA